jgi:hypothetical protein
MELHPTPMGPVFCYSDQKHIRCFPHCSGGLHYEKSFCGDSVLVTVSHSPPPTEGFGVFGEFHKAAVGRSLGLYQTMSENEISSLLKATFVGWEAGIGARYSFNPDRRWEYHARRRRGELHVFSVYYVVRSTILAMVGSTPFQLVPVQHIYRKISRQRERRERNRQRSSDAECTSKKSKWDSRQSGFECDGKGSVKQSDPLPLVELPWTKPRKSMSIGSPMSRARKTKGQFLLLNLNPGLQCRSDRWSLASSSAIFAR